MCSNKLRIYTQKQLWVYGQIDTIRLPMQVRRVERRKEERQNSPIDPQATTTTKQNGAVHNSVLSADSKRVRATNDVRCETSEEPEVRIGYHEASYATRDIFFFPVSTLVATVIVPCTCPSSSALFFPSRFAPGPAPRRRLRISNRTFSMRTYTSLSSLVRSCNNRTSFEFAAGWTGWIY